MSKTLVIGLTGSTGSGKSEVSRRLAARGCFVIDADVLARRVVQPHTPTLAALVERFSDAILNADGSLNRAALAAVAFATPETTAALNAIVHPAVIVLLKEELAAACAREEQTVVLDVPLLFQTGLESLCDVTLAVTAMPSVRRERIRARDGLSAEQAAQRMGVQPPDTYYAERATYILENNGSLVALDERLDAILNRLGR